MWLVMGGGRERAAMLMKAVYCSHPRSEFSNAKTNLMEDKVLFTGADDDSTHTLIS
jgi:hypothetical protein